MANVLLDPLRALASGHHIMTRATLHRLVLRLDIVLDQTQQACRTNNDYAKSPQLFARHSSLEIAVSKADRGKASFCNISSFLGNCNSRCASILSESTRANVAATSGRAGL